MGKIQIKRNHHILKEPNQIYTFLENGKMVKISKEDIFIESLNYTIKEYVKEQEKYNQNLRNRVEELAYDVNDNLQGTIPKNEFLPHFVDEIRRALNWCEIIPPVPFKFLITTDGEVVKKAEVIDTTKIFNIKDFNFDDLNKGEYIFRHGELIDNSEKAKLLREKGMI